MMTSAKENTWLGMYNDILRSLEIEKTGNNKLSLTVDSNIGFTQTQTHRKQCYFTASR